MTTIMPPTTQPATRTVQDPYIAYSLKLSPRGMDPIQSHKAAKRADPANRPCERCRFSIYGCVDCNWIGVVPIDQPHVHRHHWSVMQPVAQCLHSQTCLDCGETRVTDTSD